MEIGEAKRRLAAILMADVVGYSRLMGQDDKGTVASLDACRGIFSDGIANHHGRLVNAPGDSIMAEFGSVVDAVACAVEVQRALAERNAESPGSLAMIYRIGVDLGDVLVKDDALYGDGVNIAARLESLAEPGGICISGKAHAEVKGKLQLSYEFLGKQEVKNIEEAVPVFRVLSKPGAATGRVVKAWRALGLTRRKGLIAAGMSGLVAAVAIVTWLVTRPPAEDPILAMPTGPRIAVLAFENMTGDPEQEYFSDGITEEIITKLSRFSELHVLARNSTFQYKGQAVDVRKVGRDLGVKYVLEGSVRRAAETIRVTAQLLNADTGSHLWAESFERRLTPASILAVQDKIAEAVVAAIGSFHGPMFREKLIATRAKAPSNMEAYDCVMLARLYWRTILPKNHAHARNCLEAALETEPLYAQGWAELGFLYLHEYELAFNPRPDPLERMQQAARRAADLDQHNQLAHQLLALYLRHNKDESFFEKAEETLAINPNNPDILVSIGNHLAWAGHWERGIALVNKAIALNPDMPGWIYVIPSFNAYRQRNYPEALKLAKKMEMPGFYWFHFVQAINYGQLGMEKGAREEVAKLLRTYPDFGAQVRRELRIWFWEEDLIEHMIEGIRKAGLEVPDEPEDDGFRKKPASGE